MQADYRMMSLSELKEEAKKKGLKGVSTMKKQELAELLIEESEKDIKVQNEPAAKAVEPKAQGLDMHPAENRGGEERRPANSMEMRRPAPQYAERPAGAAGGMRRPMPSQTQGDMADRRMVQQPRPSYNAQSSGRPAPQEGAARAEAGARTDNMTRPEGAVRPAQPDFTAMSPKELEAYDSGETKTGILEIMSDGFGFIRCDNYLPGEHDVYVGPPVIRKYGLRTGDIVSGNTKIRLATEKFRALLYVKTINGFSTAEARRPRFEHLTPIFQ